MLAKRIAGLLLALWLGGCAMEARRPTPEPVEVFPYHFSLEYTSALPEQYYILSGPGKTYDRFPVNRDFSSRVLERLDRQGQPGAERAALLRLHVASLHTSFEEIGAVPASRPRALAEGRPRMTDLGPTLRVAGGFDADGDFNLPEETTKTATMEFHLSLAREGAPVTEKTVTLTFSERYNWYFDHPAMQNYARYSYEPVLRGLYREALTEIGRFLAGALR